MDDLRRMVIFYHVVEMRSFSAAARQLGIARSAVSRHISLLEKSIGVRLLNRTTRQVNVTEAGQTYFQSCARIVAEAEVASSRLQLLQEEPEGTLKIAAPISLGNQLIIPLVQDFMNRYPAINIELLLDDQVIDMVKEGIDISLRVGWLPDSNLVARKLGDWPRYLCASPAYLERHGTPKTPAQLSRHEWILFTLLPTPHQWVFSKNQRKEKIQVKGRLKTNNADAVHASLLAGAGIAAQTAFLVQEDIRSGRLVHLLPDWDCGRAGMYALYQGRRYQQAKIRLFIDFITGSFTSYPAG